MEGEPRSSLLPPVGAVAAILVVVLLLAGLASFFLVLPGLGLQNWLVVLFRINAGRLDADMLRVLNPIDFAVLLFVGLTFLALWPGLARGRKIWISIAVALPFIGIPLLLATRLAGRSGVMGAGLVIAFLMLRTRGLRALAYLGIVANALLLVGDFATTGSRMPVAAAAIGVGYVLLIAWLVWIVAGPLRFGARHT